jgi:hypothetical protein
MRRRAPLSGRRGTGCEFGEDRVAGGSSSCWIFLRSRCNPRGICRSRPGRPMRAGPAGSLPRSHRHPSRRACKSPSSSRPRDRGVPAASGYRSHPPADGWRTHGATHACSPSCRSTPPPRPDAPHGNSTPRAHGGAARSRSPGPATCQGPEKRRRLAGVLDRSERDEPRRGKCRGGRHLSNIHCHGHFSPARRSLRS